MGRLTVTTLLVAEPLHVTWRAGEPLLHSTFDPATMQIEQQGQIEANLAVMIMVAPR